MGKHFGLECLFSAIMVLHMDMDNYSANSYYDLELEVYLRVASSRVSGSAEGFIATFDSYTFTPIKSWKRTK